MKARILAIVIVLLCALHLNAKPYVTTQDVNVRSGAGTNYEMLGTIKDGTTIEVTDIKGTWGKVSFSGSDGYVSTQYLKDEAEEAAPAKGKGSNTMIIVLLSVAVAGLLAFILRKQIAGGISKSAEKVTETVTSIGETAVASYWYNCNQCDAVKESLDTPDAAGCTNTKKGPNHHWFKIATAGPTHYQCQKCGILITTTKLPEANGCSRGPDPLHSWEKF